MFYTDFSNLSRYILHRDAWIHYDTFHVAFDPHGAMSCEHVISATATATQFEPPFPEEPREISATVAMETSRGLRKRRLSPGISVANAKRQRRQSGLVDFLRPSQAVAWRNGTFVPPGYSKVWQTGYNKLPEINIGKLFLALIG